MTRFKRFSAVALAAAVLAVGGCRSTHTTIVEPEKHDRPEDHRDHPPPPPPPPHDHR